MEILTKTKVDNFLLNISIIYDDKTLPLINRIDKIKELCCDTTGHLSYFTYVLLDEMYKELNNI